ncbi:hypothetical protein [Aliikangiella maris]|uniref:Uncharacterized protein n=2 Tax=Aliikangiella maris TaxID=3162458 RepID=A0ABV2C0C7_9GAMM
MDSFEMGTYEQLNLITNSYFSEYKKLRQAWSVTQSHRKSKANHDHWDATERAACILSVKMISVGRVMQKNTGNRIIAPPKLRDYLTATRSLYTLTSKYDHVSNCSQLTVSDYSRFHQIANSIFSHRNSLASSYKSTNAQSIGWSNILSFELSPLPLSLEVLNGSLKIKFSAKAGPIKYDFKTGPAFRKDSKRSGLKTLLVINPDKTVRIFNIDGLKLQFYVPASLITISGDRIAIECSNSCLAEFMPE